MFKNYKIVAILLIIGNVLICCNSKEEGSFSSDVNLVSEVDSLLKTSEVKGNLINTLNEIETIRNDSLRAACSLKVSKFLLKNGRDAEFEKLNKRIYLLAKQKKDTQSLAQTQRYFGDYYLRIEKLDSAFICYQNAKKLFRLLENPLKEANQLYCISLVYFNVGNYTASEINIFKSLKLYRKVESHFGEFLCYNHLGDIYRNLYEYEKAERYHQLTESLLSEFESNYRRAMLSNNLGLVYQDWEKFDKALETFENAYAYVQKIDNPKLTAKILDNKTYVTFKKDSKANVLADFNRAYAIRDSMHNVSGKVMSKLHLSEYYSVNNEKEKAIELAKEAGTLAKSVTNYRDYLASLKLLSELDTINASNYLEQYINLRDSLDIEDRAIREKFTKIAYETDRYIEENKSLSSQRTILILLTVIVIFLGFLGFSWKSIRAKNRELKLQKDYQLANEEIYQLIANQKHEIDLQKSAIRQRISEELHDGVLGKLYGIRLALDFLKIDEELAQNHKKKYLNELELVEIEIRNLSHDLKDSLKENETDFTQLLNALFENLLGHTNLLFSVRVDPVLDWSKLKDPVKVNLYRICQELLMNTIKHANASNCALTVVLEGDCVYCIYTDDGTNFDFESKGGIGMQNIQDRCQRINGDCHWSRGSDKTFIFTLVINNI